MAKRRLKAAHKLELFGLATEKFVDKKLRKAEDQAGKALAASLIADWKREIEPVLPMLEKTGTKCLIKTISIPDEIPVLSNSKEFERPDGVTVTREAKTVLMEAALARTIDNNADIMTKFVHGGEDRPRYDNSWTNRCGRQLHRKLDLPETIFYPLSDIALHYDKVQEGSGDKAKTDYVFSVTQRKANWISKKTIELIRPYIEAGHARASAENLLWRAIGKIILSSATFEQVLEYWPEATLIESKLFPMKEPVNALMPISNEEKNLLCNNMSGRGIEAAVCKVAA